jgi:hypothetical protein
MTGPYKTRRRTVPRRLLIGLMIVLLTGCSGSSTTTESGGKRLPDTFTFFDVGANSTNGDELRTTLRGHLGREAVAGKDILDLDLFPRVSLAASLPALDAVNRQLNPDPRARKEHAITSLSFRYPQPHYPTFTFVRLVFSAFTRHPLVITIDADSSAGDIVDTLSDKYGPPRVIPVTDADAKLWSWEREGDRLIVHKHRNKFGRPAYIVAIFYLERIKELLAAEKARALDDSAGKKTAF